MGTEAQSTVPPCLPLAHSSIPRLSVPTVPFGNFTRPRQVQSRRGALQHGVRRGHGLDAVHFPLADSAIVFRADSAIVFRAEFLRRSLSAYAPDLVIELGGVLPRGAVEGRVVHTHPRHLDGVESLIAADRYPGKVGLTTSLLEVIRVEPRRLSAGGQPADVGVAPSPPVSLRESCLDITSRCLALHSVAEPMSVSGCAYTSPLSQPVGWLGVMVGEASSICAGAASPACVFTICVK